MPLQLQLVKGECQGMILVLGRHHNLCAISVDLARRSCPWAAARCARRKALSIGRAGTVQNSALRDHPRDIAMQHSQVAAHDGHPAYGQPGRRGIAVNNHVLGYTAGMWEIGFANRTDFHLALRVLFQRTSESGSRERPVQRKYVPATTSKPQLTAAMTDPESSCARRSYGRRFVRPSGSSACQVAWRSRSILVRSRTGMRLQERFRG